MNRNQYFAVSIFIIIIMYLIQYIIHPAANPIHHESVYYGVRDGMFGVFMWVSLPLAILFSVLGYLEKKK